MSTSREDGAMMTSSQASQGNQRDDELSQVVSNEWRPRKELAPPSLPLPSSSSPIVAAAVEGKTAEPSSKGGEEKPQMGAATAARGTTPAAGQDDGESDFVNKESIVSKRITIAGGFLDFALFSSNCEHLKFIIEAGSTTIQYYTLLLWLIGASLVLQLMIGILLFLTGFRKTKRITRSQASNSACLNHLTVGLVAVIAIINLMVSCFSDKSDDILQKFKNERHSQLTTASPASDALEFTIHDENSAK